MAIKSTLHDDTLQLIVDNGDRTKMDEIMNDWEFKDYQSMIRFLLSIALVTEDKYIGIKKNGRYTPIGPSAELIKKSGDSNGQK